MPGGRRSLRSRGRLAADVAFAILRNVVIDLSRARAVRPAVAEAGVEPSVEPLEQALTAWQVEEALRRIGDQHRQS